MSEPLQHVYESTVTPLVIGPALSEIWQYPANLWIKSVIFCQASMPRSDITRRVLMLQAQDTDANPYLMY